MKIRAATLALLTAIVIAACSQKSTIGPGNDAAQREAKPPNGEHEEDRGPEDDQIGEDCAAFVGATKVVPAGAASAPNAECPTCPAAGTDVLSFRQMKTDAVSCSGDTCNVAVTIRAVFNPGSGERIAGGLTGWIAPEQRSAYLRGQTPEGEQTFRVQITYKRRGDEWRAVEFDRVAGQ